jgi:hypothetical protein
MAISLNVFIFRVFGDFSRKNQKNAIFCEKMVEKRAKMAIMSGFWK